MTENYSYKSSVNHLIGWLVYFVIITLFAYQMTDRFESAFFRNLGNLLIQLFVFYINFKILLPRLWERNRKLLYFLCVVALIIISIPLLWSVLNVLDLYHPFFRRRNHGQFKIFPRGRHAIFAILNVLLPVVVGALIRANQLLKRKTKESLMLSNKVLESEMKALRSQINPHFLFNTLNNIYTLSQLKSDKTSDAVIQLSDLLRYVIYDSNNEFVLLKEEIKYIESYIKLQLLKDDEINNISVDISVPSEELKIAPMILVPIIENSFKHSNYEDFKNGWIKIQIKTENKKLFLHAENSIPEISYHKDGVGGVGMENVRKRLDMIYGKDHRLSIQKGNKSYSVNLEIDLNER